MANRGEVPIQRAAGWPNVPVDGAPETPARCGGKAARARGDGDVSDAERASEGQTVTVILADDHEIVRDGIRMILESEPNIEVVAEVGDGESARRRTSGLKPDVLVLDLNMPGGSSLPMIPSILEGSPDTAIIALTMQNDPAFARAAFRHGARGYVVKRAAARELIQAIREALSGGTYINPQLGARVAAEPEGPPGGLTAREAEVLALIAQGYTNPEIAERLVVSVRTVETHRAAIHRKVGTTNRAELVRYAREHGLVDAQT
ncbi:MAG: response regulator [Solirubrobacterales bacterium]|nr:response regulator [Solirubrobacterales bacterium]